MREHGWPLTDCLNEIAFCRRDILSCLQPRPRAQAPPARVNPSEDMPDVPAPPPGKRRRRSKGMGKARESEANPKAKPKSTATLRPAAQEFDKSWFKKVNGDEVCMRVVLGRCKNPSCKFAHVCPVPLPNGKPCGQKHTAAEHQRTKH